VNYEKTHVDLFSGIGGFSVASHWNGYRTTAFCEADAFCQAVLKKYWPSVPIVSDIRAFKGKDFPRPTLLTGGFPCQPFSVAGKKLGQEDNRYLWPEMFRVIQETQPTWVVGENVVGIINLALDQVCADLESEGFEVETLIIPACGVEAPHRRDRVWVLAYSKHNGQLAPSQGRGFAKAISIQPQEQGNSFNTSGASCIPSPQNDVAYTIGLSEGSAHRGEEWASGIGWENKSVSEGGEVGCYSANSGKNVANTNPEGWEGWLQGGTDKERQNLDGHLGCCRPAYGQQGEAVWLLEPNVGRLADGVSARVAKLKALGNAIVPQVAHEIIKHINKVEEMNK